MNDSSKENNIPAAAGCQLIAACDLVVCSDKSSFSTPGYLQIVNLDYIYKLNFPSRTVRVSEYFARHQAFK